MTDKLRALSLTESRLFDRRRESAAVVQNRCDCGTWYESDKGDQVRDVRFDCERCGAKLEFKIPAVDGVRAPSNAEVLAMLDPLAKLDTGMSGAEAVKRASAWWQKTGRRIMKSEAKRQRQALTSSDKGNGGVFASQDPDDPRFLPSGLLHGHPWDHLDRRSKIQVVKIWHHFNIRKSDLIGGDPEERFKMNDRQSVN